MSMVIEAVGHRVLIDPIFPKETTDAGIIVNIGNAFDKAKADTQEGYIVGYGKNAWKAFDDGEPWVEVGDKVIFAKHAGKFCEVEEDGETKVYVVVNDEDVQARLNED